MRNERGYHDSRWWPIAHLVRFWAEDKETAMKLIDKMDLHGAFHHAVFNGLPRRRLITAQESFSQLPMSRQATEAKAEGEDDDDMKGESAAAGMDIFAIGPSSREQKSGEKRL